MRTSFFEALTFRVAATCSRDGTFSDNGLVDHRYFNKTRISTISQGM